MFSCLFFCSLVVIIIHNQKNVTVISAFKFKCIIEKTCSKSCSHNNSIFSQKMTSQFCVRNRKKNSQAISILEAMCDTIIKFVIIIHSLGIPATVTQCYKRYTSVGRLEKKSWSTKRETKEPRKLY